MQEIIKEYELKRKINNFLYEIKMKTTNVGFCYWLNAMTFYLRQKINNNYDIASISEVYNYIAEKYSTSVSCIEKAMRYAKENSKYKEVLKIDSNLKNHAFLILCTNNLENCCINNDAKSRQGGYVKKC